MNEAWIWRAELLQLSVQPPAYGSGWDKPLCHTTLKEDAPVLTESTLVQDAHYSEVLKQNLQSKMQNGAKGRKKEGKKKKKAFLYFVQVNVRVPFSSSDAYQKGDWDFPCFALLLLTLRFPGQELSISWCFLFFFGESWSSVHSKHNNTAQYSNNKITYIQICYMLDECISSKLKQLWCRCLPPSKCLAYHYGLKRSSCYSNWRKTSDFSSFEGGKSHPSLYWPCLVFFHLLARDPRWFAQVRLLTL